MKRKGMDFRQARRQQAMLDNTRDSRNSVTGYLERGNDALIHAKARAVRNNDNGSHI